MQKRLLIISIMAFFLFGSASLAHAGNLPSVNEDEYAAEMEERGRELVRALIEQFYEFLEEELYHLQKGDSESEKKLRQRIREFEEAIKRNPEEPEPRFLLGEIYDELGDGASAIIQTKMAEEFYVREKDVKGAAECRRNLRVYFKKYGFKPDDFILIR